MVLVRHHIKYKEIHGYDETVWMEQSEHKKLHNRLRRNGECGVPSGELRKISSSAYIRGNIKIKTFYVTIHKNVVVRQHIRCNTKTGNITIDSGFKRNNVIS